MSPPLGRAWPGSCRSLRAAAIQPHAWAKRHTDIPKPPRNSSQSKHAATMHAFQLSQFQRQHVAELKAAHSRKVDVYCCPSTSTWRHVPKCSRDGTSVKRNVMHSSDCSINVQHISSRGVLMSSGSLPLKTSATSDN